MIDVHAHFAEEGYSEGEWELIKNAGVERVILASDTLPHSETHCKIASARDNVYFCAGVHPSETDDFNEETLQRLKMLARHEKCVAVGEIGLDYHYPDTDKGKQREAFLRQLELAFELNLPVQIHSRDCAMDTLSILRECKELLPNGFLLHCYSHGREMMDDFLSLGAYFSFGGVICFHNAKRAVESAIYCPLERVLTETDSPYLSPFRGEKNSPKNIPVVLQKLASLKGEEAGTLEMQIEENARRLFQKLK